MSRYKELYTFLAPFKKGLLLALICTAVLTAIGMAPPMLMARLVNDIAREGNWGIFPLIMGLMVVVPILRALVNVVNAIALNSVSQGIVVKTRKRLYRHLMRLSMDYFDRTPVGHINQRLMGDVGQVAGIAGGGLIALVADVVAVVMAVIFMLKLSPSLSLLTFALLPLYYLNYRFFSGRIQASTAILRTRMDHVSSALQERLSAHELMQAYGQERNTATQFSSQAKQIMDAAIHGSAYSISFNQLSAFINKVGSSAIYALGCYYFIDGRLGYGDVIAFCAYATQLLGPVVRVSQLANQLVQVGVSVDRLNQVLHEAPAIRDTENPLPIATLEGSVHIAGLSFRYDADGELVLRELNLDIPAGTHLAIVGPPGAGRSSLAMVIRRFYDPDAGEIRVDDLNIRGYKLRDYRQALSMVQSESAIFDGTIRENLLYGKPDASEERMLEVAKAVGLHDLVQELAAGYDTRLGSGALRLSAGNQQRVGIARALLSEPMILILDDATASLDSVSAEDVLQAVRADMAGRTCILMVPRLLMARDADRIAVLVDGAITEEGQHDDLIGSEESMYRQLYAAQYGEERLPPVVGGPS